MNDDFSNIGDDLNYLISIAEKYFNRDISSNTNENDTSAILTAISNYAEMQNDRIETIDFTPVIDALNSLDTNVIVQNNLELQTRIDDLKKDLDISLNVDVKPNIDINDIQSRLSEIKDLVVNIEPSINPSLINVDVDANVNIPDIDISPVNVDVILNVLDDISTIIKPVSVDVIPNIKDLNIEPISVQVNPIISDIDISPINIDANVNIPDISPINIDANVNIPDISPIDIDADIKINTPVIEPISIQVNPIISDIDISPVNVQVNPVIGELPDLSVNIKPIIDMSDFNIVDDTIFKIESNTKNIDNQENNQLVSLMSDNNKLLVDLISRIDNLSGNINNSNIVNNINNDNISNNNSNENISNINNNENVVDNVPKIDYTNILNDISSTLSTLVKSNKSRRFSNDLDI